MSGKERGVFQLIWKSFYASIKPNIRKSNLVGEDFYGTKYYELAPRPGSYKKPSRYFVPVNKDDHEQEIPPEWESWLRNRRKIPPTQEEVIENYKLAMTKKQNAAEIEAKYASVRLPAPNLPVAKKGYESFPQYEEYKNDGRDYKIKYPK